MIVAYCQKIDTKQKTDEINDSTGFGTPSRTRTVDTLIKSQVLYQLS